MSQNKNELKKNQDKKIRISKIKNNDKLIYPYTSRKTNINNNLFEKYYKYVQNDTTKKMIKNIENELYQYRRKSEIMEKEIKEINLQISKNHKKLFGKKEINLNRNNKTFIVSKKNNKNGEMKKNLSQNFDKKKKEKEIQLENKYELIIKNLQSTYNLLIDIIEFLLFPKQRKESVNQIQENSNSIDIYDNNSIINDEERKNIIFENIQKILIYKLTSISSYLNFELNSQILRIKNWNFSKENNSNLNISNISFNRKNNSLTYSDISFLQQSPKFYDNKRESISDIYSNIVDDDFSQSIIKQNNNESFSLEYNDGFKHKEDENNIPNKKLIDISFEDNLNNNNFEKKNYGNNNKLDNNNILNNNENNIIINKNDISFN